MRSSVATPVEYLASLPEDRRVVVAKLRDSVLQNLPKGFEECMEYGMLADVVPNSRYPAGYHCDTSKPLPFMKIASQKNDVSVYHMGLYDGPLLEWFRTAWAKEDAQKLDVGKCCFRLKRLDGVPYGLIGQLAKRITVAAWIETYEASLATSSSGSSGRTRTSRK
jgi:hypothetical protein